MRCDGTITGAFPSRHHRRGGRTRTSCRVRSPPPPTLAPPLASTLHPSLSRACAQGSMRDRRLLGIDAPGPPRKRPGGSSLPGPPRPPGGGWHLGRKQIDPPPLPTTTRQRCRGDGVLPSGERHRRNGGGEDDDDNNDGTVIAKVTAQAGTW